MNYSQYDAHENYWRVVPEVIVCKSQTIFSENQIKYALDLWGESYSRISIREKCNYQIEYGKIKIIDGKQLKKDQNGYTSYIYRDVKVNNKVVREHESALVQLDRNINDISLLVHEIGHAFGYNHYNENVDVMNSHSHRHRSGKYPY
tara:strand:+ start:1907 stop:2347 length:441 start_codon:yes stop_codon:yes gene_type:complete